MALPQFDFYLYIFFSYRSLNGAASALGLPFSLPLPDSLPSLASLSLSSPVFCVKTHPIPPLPSCACRTCLCICHRYPLSSPSQSSSIQSQHIAQHFEKPLPFGNMTHLLKNNPSTSYYRLLTPFSSYGSCLLLDPGRCETLCLWLSTRLHVNSEHPSDDR